MYFNMACGMHACTYICLELERDPVGLFNDIFLVDYVSPEGAWQGSTFAWRIFARHSNYPWNVHAKSN